MRRGEIYLVNFDPARPGEANKQRPAVIVSNDGANSAAQRSGHGVITVVPVTSMVERIYPFQVLIPINSASLDRESKAQAEQVHSISIERIGPVIGELPHALMEKLDEALRLHLAL